MTTAPLTGTVAIVTGASSGIGEATARRLAREGATVALIARRLERLDAIATEIEAEGGRALAVEADISDRAQTEHAVKVIIDRFGHLDTLVNNAGLMLLGSVEDTDPEDWDRMLATNLQGLLYVTSASLPHLVAATDTAERRVADIVNISSVAGRVASAGYGVYSMTKFGVNAFADSLRKEVTQRHVRVGVIEPGGVQSELVSHNTGEVLEEIQEFFDSTETLVPDDIADAVAYMVTRPRRASVGQIWVMPTEQVF